MDNEINKDPSVDLTNNNVQNRVEEFFEQTTYLH